MRLRRVRGADGIPSSSVGRENGETRPRDVAALKGAAPADHLVGAVAPVAVRRIVPGRVGIAVRVGVIRIWVGRVGVVRDTERDADDETAVESSTVVEEDAVVPKPVETSREVTELVAAELTAEPTTGEAARSEAPAPELAAEPTTGNVPRPETPATKRSTEASDVPTTETAEVATRKTATPNVSAAKASATVMHSDGERDAAVQGER